MSRVFHSAQRPTGEYNLTLFTYASELLHGEPRGPNGVVSVEEASRLLASSAVYTRVRLGLLAPDDAEKRSAELALAIQKQFAPGGGKEPLRWRMLIEFLSDVLGPELASAPADAVPSLGEAWWSVLQLQR
jgi:hypothetical protein